MILLAKECMGIHFRCYLKRFWQLIYLRGGFVDSSAIRGLKRIPKVRLRDIVRTALMLRSLTEEEMLRRGLAWIDEALRISGKRGSISDAVD